MDKKKKSATSDNIKAKSASLEAENNNLREALKQYKDKQDVAENIIANYKSDIQQLLRDREELFKTIMSLQTKHLGKGNGFKITNTVIPATDNVTAEEISEIKKFIQADVFYLENITKCSCYPVPTIIVDSIPEEDREKAEGGGKMHWLGCYFHQGSKPSKQFKNILENYGYKDLFINSLFETGVVAIGYQDCKKYAEREFRNHRDYEGGFEALFADVLNAVLIHEHAHAITFEGIDSANCQVRYEYRKFCKTHAYKVVCESIAEWLSLNYYRDNSAMFQIIKEHSENNNASLLNWPYGVAIYIEKVYEKDKEIFEKIFNTFRRNIEEAVPLYLKGATEPIIKLFCSYRDVKTGNKLKALAKKHGNILNDAIEFANSEGFIKFLIDGGGDVNAKDNQGTTALVLASKKDFAEIVKLLIEKGAKVDETDNLGRTSLMFAARGGFVDVVEHLMANKADVNIKDGQGTTALMLASEKGFIEIVRRLKARAHFNEKDNKGRTALMFAARGGFIEVVSHLIKNGAKVYETDNKNRTSLMFALENGNEEVIKFLIDRWQKFDYEDKSGVTPIELAKRKGLTKIAEIMEKKEKNQKSLKQDIEATFVV